jgi:hypothetical protein
MACLTLKSILRKVVKVARVQRRFCARVMSNKILRWNWAIALLTREMSQISERKRRDVWEISG